MSNYAIYQPKNKAAEYAKWACNFYTGCSNDCDYCYCKRGVMSSVWSTTPQLKKCFKDEAHAMEVFQKELIQNLPELQKHGLFFSFTTDPMLPETIYLTLCSLVKAVSRGVPLKILTKNAAFLDYSIFNIPSLKLFFEENKHLIAFLFTLTGHDDVEPGASTNQERITSMSKLKSAGFWTGASIEPIIDLTSSFSMIQLTHEFCDLYKVGLLSGKKYDFRELREFIVDCSTIPSKFYFKDSLLEQAQVDRKDLPANCVQRDYNMFKQQ